MWWAYSGFLSVYTNAFLEEEVVVILLCSNWRSWSGRKLCYLNLANSNKERKELGPLREKKTFKIFQKLSKLIRTVQVYEHFAISFKYEKGDKFCHALRVGLLSSSKIEFRIFIPILH
jgi:hypothetical protein